MANYRWHTAHNTELSVPLAGVGLRLLACIIDGLIKIGYIVLLITIFVQLNMNDEPSIWVIFLLISPYLFYSLAFEYFNTGQTPGKLICNISVVDIEGGELTLQAVFLRWILRPVDLQIMSGLIGLLAVGLSRNQQRLGDMLGGTLVIKTKTVRQLNDGLFQNAADNYHPTYPIAKQLSESEARLIVKAKSLSMGPSRDSILVRLSDSIQTRHQFVTNAEPRRFLFTLLRDYNYYKQSDEDLQEESRFDAPIV